MKNDIKINYGILDGIIEQLHVYKNALNTMHSSLAKISAVIAENRGESIDAWEERIQDSQNYIKDYQEQVNDLLSLFENYVGETTAYITPLARHAMMRVDRNDIWFNLQQMETGILNNLPKAYLTANREPFPTFFLSDEEKEREIEKSRSNQAKLQMISREIQSSQRSLDNKMERLWRLYNSKVKNFEIVDDQYQVKALKMKYKYTSIFEGMWDAIEDMSKDVFDLLRGVAVGLYSIVTGLAILVIDAGIVAVSSVIPDTIEPDFINKAANKRIDQYTEAIVEAIKDPIGVIESISQSISDTYEEEGIMYVTGSVASSFIPIVGMATKLSKISKLTSKTPDSKPKPVSDTIKAKVDDLVKNNQAFEGFKRGTMEFVKGVKGGAVIFMDGVVGGMKKMVNPDHNVVYSTGGPMPWKVTNPKIVQDRIEDVVSKFAVKIASKGGSGSVDETAKMAEIQRLQEALRSRILGYNHEQGKFSYNETLGISRAEKALNKKFQPSDTLGVDMKDPGGLGNVSLKGPFLNSKQQPLTPVQQEAVIKSLTKHINHNTAVDVHIIDTLGLNQEVVKGLKEALKNSKVKIIYLE